MPGEAWTALGVVAAVIPGEAWTALGGIVVALISYPLMVLVKHRLDRREEAPTVEPVAATDYAQQHITTLVQQVERLEAENDELQEQYMQEVRVHGAAFAEFQAFKARTEVEMATLRDQIADMQAAGVETERRLLARIQELTEENERLRDQLAAVRGL